MFDAQLRRDPLNGIADPRGNLSHFWIKNAKFRHCRNVKQNAHVPVPPGSPLENNLIGRAEQAVQNIVIKALKCSFVTADG